MAESGGTFGIEFRVTRHTYFIAGLEKSRKKWEQLFVGYICAERVREAACLHGRECELANSSARELSPTRHRVFVFLLRISSDDLLIVTL